MHNSYCLSNFVDNTSQVQEPLKQSNRIKYTCFDVSDNYIIFGATSGSLYLFHRHGCKFLHFVPNKHGSVVNVEISPDEKYVAFSTAKSMICVYAITLHISSTPQIVYSNLGRGIEVTCIRWTSDEKQFFYGDNIGQVNVVILNTFIGRSLINLSVHTILLLENPIVQIDNFESLLLISNWSKCILCNTEYEDYKQIGNRQRDGPYGACFAISSNESETPSRIYCARPGSRLWEVDFDGDVLQTHQLKDALACAPSEIESCTLAISSRSNETDEFQPQTLIFSQLQMITENLLFTYTDCGVYVFDVRTSSVAVWNNQFERISKCRVITQNREIVVFTDNGSLYTLRLDTLERYAVSLVRLEKPLECGLFLRKHLKYFTEKVLVDKDLSLLGQIQGSLFSQEEVDLLEDLSVIFDNLAQCQSNKIERPTKTIDTQMQKPRSFDKLFRYNLRLKEKEQFFKNALFTVSGKVGKNIVKYKLKLFSKEQKSMDNDLVVNTERTLPFQHIEGGEAEEVICPRKPPPPPLKKQQISDEDKLIYNLYLISRSSQMSNKNFLERYRALFDEYSSREIIDILHKLERVMMEHGDSENQAKKNCSLLYLNYLQPGHIWNLDHVSREFIIRSFFLVNENENSSTYCKYCGFPLRFKNSCQFPTLGGEILRLLWSRNERARCFQIIKTSPTLYDVLAKLYLDAGEVYKTVPIAMIYGQAALFEEAGKNFTPSDWDRCYNIFIALQQGQLTCVNCERTTSLPECPKEFFYTWTSFLTISLELLQPDEILDLLYKYSHHIPNGALDSDFFTKCMLK